MRVRAFRCLRQTRGVTADDNGGMNDIVALRDYAGRFICFVHEGNVYDTERRYIGFIDSRGTFDDRRVRVSTTANPSLLAGLALGRRLRAASADELSDAMRA